MAEEELLSLTEAAAYLDVTRQSVHSLAKNGKLTGKRIGNAWVFTRAALDAYKVTPRHAGGRPKKGAGPLQRVMPA